MGVKSASGERNLCKERAAGSKTGLQNPWDTIFKFYLSWCKGGPIYGVGLFGILIPNRIVEAFNEIEPGGQGVNGYLEAAFNIKRELSD